MKRLFTGPAFALALSASAFMTGCGGEATTTDEPSTPAATDGAAEGEEEAAGDADAAATDGAATDGLTADQVEAFASLSPAIAPSAASGCLTSMRAPPASDSRNSASFARNSFNAASVFVCLLAAVVSLVAVLV